MESTDIRGRLEEIGLKPDQIDDVLPLLEVKETPPEGLVFSSVDDLRAQMLLEVDPIKRSILAAKIISLSLDVGY